MELNTDVIVVGSGVGGSTAARELAKKGKKVIILEKGELCSPKQWGSEVLAFKFYDKYGLWSRSREGVFYYRTIMAGGTSIVSCGNGVRSLEKELKSLGIDLNNEFRQAEKELGVGPVPKRLIGPGTAAIMRSAQGLGVKMVPMPKLINFKKCIGCGNCVVGCRTGAKWTALDYLYQAQRLGATLMTGINVNRILSSRGVVTGVEGHNKLGTKVKIIAPVVILAAGGIGTPVILLNSGIKAGRKLFLDLFTVTFGITKNLGMSQELTMAAVNHDNKGFILSPFIDTPFALASVVPVPLRRNLKILTKRKDMLGIMVKINDDSRGSVSKDGKIGKKLTRGDLSKLKKGADISKKILIGAGAAPETIITTKVRGAHPGGTAAIGEVVDKNLQTKIKNLYVADGSVLPKSPGLPPIVTIVALAKRLAKRIK
ncbi:MAG: GMC family oxidoreductase [Candidatus Omnitrophica bacterium]|nr:GMC family oxidoreductase [Candidatus Omnitrophota bacterium]